MKKSPGTVRFRGLFDKLSLAELGSAAGCLESVLLRAAGSESLDITGFFSNEL